MLDKKTVLGRLDLRTFYKEAMPSLTGDPQASGRCPFHGDQWASFSTNFDKTGGPWTCHAGLKSVRPDRARIAEDRERELSGLLVEALRLYRRKAQAAARSEAK